VSEAPNDVTEYRPHIEGDVGRYVEDRTGDDYKQAGEIYRAFDDRHRNDLIDNLVANLKKADPRIQERMVWHFLHADEDYGTRVATGLGIDVEKARKLPPLPNKPAPGTTRNATDNVPGVQPSGAPYAATRARAAATATRKRATLRRCSVCSPRPRLPGRARTSLERSPVRSQRGRRGIAAPVLLRYSPSPVTRIRSVRYSASPGAISSSPGLVSNGPSKPIGLA
jgi:hypothetical protein